jgi:hypothetical protein
MRCKLTVDGLLIDTTGWTKEDWRDIGQAINENSPDLMERIRRAAARLEGPCYYCQSDHKPEDWCEQKREAWRQSANHKKGAKS